MEYIPVQAVLERIMHGTVLDVMYLLLKHKELYKAEIIRKFCDVDPNGSQAKYRPIVDMAIAKLEAGMLIDTIKVKNKDLYFLSKYGKEGSAYFESMLDAQPVRLMGSVILRDIPVDDNYLESIMNGTVLDMMYILLRAKHPLNKDSFIKSFMDADSSQSSKFYKDIVESGLRKLSIGGFVEVEDKEEERYYSLSAEGNKARNRISDLLANDPNVLSGSIVLNSLNLNSK